jgi:hypothetical protein
MYLLSTAGKLCHYCSQSENIQDRAGHVAEIMRMLNESFACAEYDHDNDKITAGELRGVENLVLECKLLCYDCDGKSPKIHKKIDEDFVQLIKKEIEKIRIVQEKEEEVVGETGKPSNIYFINFQKKVVSGR